MPPTLIPILAEHWQVGRIERQYDAKDKGLNRHMGITIMWMGGLPLLISQIAVIYHQNLTPGHIPVVNTINMHLIPVGLSVKPKFLGPLVYPAKKNIFGISLLKHVSVSIYFLVISFWGM